VLSNKATVAVYQTVRDWDGRYFGKRWLSSRNSTRSNYLNNPEHNCNFARIGKRGGMAHADRPHACDIVGALGPSPDLTMHALLSAPAEVCRSRGAASLYQSHQITQPAFDVTFGAADEDDCQPPFLGILDGRKRW